MATRRFDFKFHCIKDADIIQRLDAQENKQQYIRQLISTDIMADTLRKAFQIGDTHAVSTDPEESIQNMRIDFYNERCRAISETDPNADPCSGCVYSLYPDFSDHQGCTLESVWEDYWKNERKTKLNSVYGRMLKDPFKDDVINNILEDD